MNALETIRSRHGTASLLVFLEVTALLSVLCWDLERILPGAPGQVCLLVLLVPCAAAGLAGGFRHGLLTGLVTFVGCPVASWMARYAEGGRVEGLAVFIMPTLSGLVLLATGACLGIWSEWTWRKAEDLGSAKDVIARELYQLKRVQDPKRPDDELADVPCAEEKAPPTPRPNAQLSKQARELHYPTLLLRLKDIGQQIAGTLDPERLPSLISETACKLLSATRAEVYLLTDDRSCLQRQSDDTDRPQAMPTDKGVFGWVLQNRQILMASDAQRDYTLANLHDDQGVPSVACAPLLVGGEVVGVLNIEETTEQSPEFDRLLYILANFSAMGIKNAQMFRKIEDMARRDGLTGLLNHATFQAQLAKTIAETRESAGHCAVVLSDIDKFKNFNDKHGHQTGDFVLRSVADLWRTSRPEGATQARYGGEEFICLLPRMGCQEARLWAEYLRAALETARFEFQGTGLQVTASFGVACYPEHGETPEEVIASADGSLYSAKEAGRNRVVAADEDPGVADRAKRSA